MESTKLIELRDLSKRMGKTQVLSGATLRVEPGECVTIVGPSGSGKTTLLRLVAGLERPDSGTILLRGEVANRAGWLQPPHGRSIGFQFQDSALWPHMTLLENLAYGLEGDRNRAMECLKRAGLSELALRKPEEISGGEARRASLARALAPRRDIVLLDEPLTSLQAVLRAQIAHWVREELKAVNAACLWVTHDPSETGVIAGRVFTIEEGRLLETRS